MLMRSMRSLAMMAIVSIMAPPTVSAFMAAPAHLRRLAPVCAIGSPRNSSSSSGSHSRTPPVMPAVLLTILTCAGSSKAILRALPPPI